MKGKIDMTRASKGRDVSANPSENADLAALCEKVRALEIERDAALAEIKRLCAERDTRAEGAGVLARAERETEQARKERDAGRADFESLAFDAARVIVAHERGDVDALARAIESLRSNGRDKWWEDV